MGDLLIVDDEASLAQSYARFFERSGHAVRVADSGAAALARFGERRPDVVLLDVHLPDMTGFEVFDRLKAARPVVIMISGQAEVPLAVRAVQEGAETFLTKPVDLSHLGVAMERALDVVRLRHLSRHVNERRASTGRVALGASPAMAQLTEQVTLLAETDRTTVLLLGEPGTGKGRIAELIHARSSRAAGPFTEVHCSASTAEVLESELFGVEGGAVPRPGLVEVAAGGTLFLDEVADLPLTLQPKVLRLLEGRPMRRVGGSHDIPCDVRIIGASSRDLIAMVNGGRLREDLYYRLSVMPVRLPPLRERAREDVAELIARLIEELVPQLPNAPRQVSDEALERLLRHAWPGNIRELRNVIERSMIVAQGRALLDVDALPADIRGRGASGTAGAGGIGVGGGVGVGTDEMARIDIRTLEEMERDHIAGVLRAFRGNRSQAARALGISRATLIRKIREFGFAEVPLGSA